MAYTGNTVDNNDNTDFDVLQRTESSASVQMVDVALVQIDTCTVATATAATASATIIAADADRRFFSIFNTHATDTAYINIGAAATTAKIPIRAGEWFHSASLGVTFVELVAAIRGGSNDITLVVVTGT